MRLSTTLCLGLTVIGLCSGCTMLQNPFASRVDPLDAARDRMAADMRVRVERGDVEGARDLLAQLEEAERRKKSSSDTGIRLTDYSESPRLDRQTEAQIEELAAMMAAPGDRPAKRAELRQYSKSQLNQMLASYKGLERNGQKGLSPWENRNDTNDRQVAEQRYASDEEDEVSRPPSVAGGIGSQRPWQDREKQPLQDDDLVDPTLAQRQINSGHSPASPRQPDGRSMRDSQAFGYSDAARPDTRKTVDNYRDGQAEEVAAKLPRDAESSPNALRQVSGSRIDDYSDWTNGEYGIVHGAPEPRSDRFSDESRDETGTRRSSDEITVRSSPAILGSPFEKGGIPTTPPQGRADSRPYDRQLPAINPKTSAASDISVQGRSNHRIDVGTGLDSASGSTKLSGPSESPLEHATGHHPDGPAISSQLDQSAGPGDSFGPLSRGARLAQREITGGFQKVRDTIGFGDHATQPPLIQQPATIEALILETERTLAQVAPGESEDEQLEYLRRHVDLRMMYLMSGQVDRALEPIPRVHGADQEFWQKTLWALSNYFDKQGIPQASARATETIDQLNVAIARLRQKADLKLHNVAFCSRILSFGSYERFDEDVFDPGQAVLLYAELENFRSVQAEGDQYRTAVESSCEIFRTDGRDPQLIESIDFDVTEDYCRNHRRDYFQSYQFSIPTNLPPGNYMLVLRAIDQLSRKVATARVNFRVHTDLR